MMTPEPDGGFYKDADEASFIRKFGYADKHDKPDRLNFGGRGARLCEPQHFRPERGMEIFHPNGTAKLLRVADPSSARIRVRLWLKSNG
ncbi:MAG: hypothetical protein AAB370_06775 [Verrucomicrobiota bacterium]